MVNKTDKTDKIIGKDEIIEILEKGLQPDYAHWRRQSLWYLWQASCLLLDIDPRNKDIFDPIYISPFLHEYRSLQIESGESVTNIIKEWSKHKRDNRDEIEGNSKVSV